MKKMFSILAIAFVIGGCAKKITPTVAVPVTTTKPVATATSSPIAMGQTIYTAKCGRCHELKITTDFTANDWGNIMESMAKKAHLTDDEKANVLAYVKANAKQ